MSTPITLKTNTKTDTGHWFRPAPIQLTISNTDLTLHAAGPRPFHASIPLADCRASRYHHPTGELLIEPAVSLPIRKLQIDPQDALRALRSLSPSTTPTPVC